jgi:hypothetical protein
LQTYWTCCSVEQLHVFWRSRIACFFFTV